MARNNLVTVFLLALLILALTAEATPLHGSSLSGEEIVIIPSQMNNVVANATPQHPFDTVSIGNASIDPCLWGLSNIRNRTGLNGYSVMTINDHVLRAETDLDLEKLELPPWRVIGYNEIIYGLKPWGMPPWHKIPSTLKLPMKIKDLPEITLTTQYRIERVNTGLDLAYDIWIKQENKTDGVHPGDVEIMIWLYHNHVHPAGRQVATITLPTKINGTITNTKWQVWIYPHMGTGWLYIAYIIDNPIKKGEVTINLTQILTHTSRIVQQTLGEKLGEMYMMSIELGTEIFYNKQIHVEWTMTKYTIKTYKQPQHPNQTTITNTTQTTGKPTTTTTPSSQTSNNTWRTPTETNSTAPYKTTSNNQWPIWWTIPIIIGALIIITALIKTKRTYK